MHRYTYVFADDPDPSDDAFFGQLDRAFGGLEALGYEFTFESEETFPDETQQLVWEEAEERVRATVIKDGVSGLCYLVLTAGRRADAREVFRALERMLEFASLEHLLAETPRRMLFHPIWLVKLALAAGDKPESHVLAVLREGLTHQGPALRLHAAMAVAQVRWPAMIPDLEQLLKGEPDNRVRQMARQALEWCIEARDRRLRARR
jgi:hypothetical protein